MQKHICAQMVSATQHLMSYVDREFYYRHASCGYQALLGRPVEQIIGKHVSELHSSEVYKNSIEPKLESCLKGEQIHHRIWVDSATLGRRFIDATLTPITEPSHEISGIVVSAHDITDLVELQHELEELSARDELTKCFNRRYLIEAMRQLLAKIQRDNSVIGIAFFLDLDEFKSLNDQYGHLAGDCALKTIAERLQSVVRANDVLARYGGDEFVLLCELSSKDWPLALSTAKVVSDKIKQSFTEPFYYQGQEIELGCSIGFTLIDHYDTNIDTVLQRADNDMYNCKQSSKTR